MAYRSADGGTPVALIGDRLGESVLQVRPGVVIPGGAPLDVIERPSELVRAAFGDANDLNSARPAVLGLIGRRNHTHLGNGVRRDRQSLLVAACVHGGHAVQQVVRPGAVGTRHDGAKGAQVRCDDARYQLRVVRVVAVAERQELDRLLGDDERPLACLRLDDRRGDVKDTSGGVIPGAAVTLVSEGQGTSISATTNETGDFVVPNIPGDTYTIRVEQAVIKARSPCASADSTPSNHRS
jgi:hypothetical protein